MFLVEIDQLSKLAVNVFAPNMPASDYAAGYYTSARQPSDKQSTWPTRIRKIQQTFWHQLRAALTLAVRSSTVKLAWHFKYCQLV